MSVKNSSLVVGMGLCVGVAFMNLAPGQLSANKFVAPQGSVIQALPATITSCGTYTLETCLTGVAGQSGITVNADNVTINLDGFSLLGVAGSQDGINVVNGISVVTIRNGIIRGWGGHGIGADDGNNMRISDLTLVGNGLDEATIGSSSLVTNCIAEGNGSAGFSLDFGNVVSECSAASNNFNGFIVGLGSSVSNCVAFSNEQNGFLLLGDNLITTCIARGNDSDGIHSVSGVQVTDCVTIANGRHGVFALSEAHISNGTSKGNTLDGIVAGGGSRLDENHLVGNRNGVSMSGSDNIFVRNTAVRNSGSNYSGSSSNFGSGNTSGGTPLSNPWVNWDQ